MDRWATFDCYGTLIDWDGGIARELARLWPHVDVEISLARYHALEPVVQRADPSRPYRDVLRLTLIEVAADLGLTLEEQDADSLGRSLPDWPPFPEVHDALAAIRAAGWRLAILSNTDRDFIEASKERIGIDFDETVVASEIGSYKPAHKHWDEFFARTGVQRERHVHVAASLFHDIGPAHELGLTSVWINRTDEEPGPRPTREQPDLIRLPETLEDLVPP